MDRKRTEKLPEYLIIDNFEKYFGLEKDDLMTLKSDGKVLYDEICDQSTLPQQNTRCDSLLWFKDLETNVKKDLSPEMIKVGKVMKSFRSKLNTESQNKYGNKKLKVDEEEIIL